MALIYRTNGTIEYVEPKNGSTFSLAELQDIVGGHIETAPTIFHNEVLVVNEEGKFLGLEYNKRATALYRYPGHDIIVGDALKCGIDEIQ